MSQLIIITGAAGFIGRNVIAELNRRGQTQLLLVDKLGTGGKWHNLVGLEFEDIIAPDLFLQQVKAGNAPKAAACMHLGGSNSTTETDADHLLENNYSYTRTLCEWSLRQGTRFVYASTAATYGDGSLGYSDDDTVTPKLRPLNMYAFSKHLFDLWALRNGLFDRIVGLKYFNVFGPYEDHKGNMRSVVKKAYHQIRTSGYLELFKSAHPDYRDGEQKRDFTYVRDAVDVTLHFALADAQTSGLFNCGSGSARTWMDLAHALFQAMDTKPDIRFIDLPEAMRAQYQYFTQADTSKLRKAGYGKSFTSLEQGVEDYVKSYLASGTT